MTIEERAHAYALEHFPYSPYYEETFAEYKLIAEEQKEIDDAERKGLIEKVIWLIETSYYDTQLWTHDELVEHINKDLDKRAEELKKMFG